MNHTYPDFPYWSQYQVNSHPGSGYQAYINLAWKQGMFADFRDIRFHDNKGVKLNYWIESYTSGSTALVWVKLSSSSTVTLRWGNPAAISESSGSNTMELYDDLITLDGTKWTSSSAAVSNGLCTVTYPGSLTSTATFGRGYELIFRSRSVLGGGATAVGFGASNKYVALNCYGGDTYYELWTNNGSDNLVNTTVDRSAAENNWYSYRLYYGSTPALTVVTTGNTVTTTTQVPSTSLNIIVLTEAQQCHVDLDYIAVRKHNGTNPTFTYVSSGYSLPLTLLSQLSAGSVSLITKLFSSSNDVQLSKTFTSTNDIAVKNTFTSTNDIDLSKVFSSSNDLQLIKPFTSTNDIVVIKTLSSSNDLQQSKSFTSTNDIQVLRLFTSTNDLQLSKTFSNVNDIQVLKSFSNSNDIQVISLFFSANDIQLYCVFQNDNDILLIKTFTSTNKILTDIELITKLFSSSNDIQVLRTVASTNNILQNKSFTSENDIRAVSTFSSTNDVQVAPLFASSNDIRLSKLFTSQNDVRVLTLLTSSNSIKLSKLFSSENKIALAKTFSSNNNILLTKLFSSENGIFEYLVKLFSSSNDINVNTYVSSENNIKLSKLFSSSNKIIVVYPDIRPIGFRQPLTFVIFETEKTVELFEGERTVELFE